MSFLPLILCDISFKVSETEENKPDALVGGIGTLNFGISELLNFSVSFTGSFNPFFSNILVKASSTRVSYEKSFSKSIYSISKLKFWALHAFSGLKSNPIFLKAKRSSFLVTVIALELLFFSIFFLNHNLPDGVSGNADDNSQCIVFFLRIFIWFLNSAIVEW